MGELEVDDQERPLFPPVLKSIRVISHPFNDIIPRKDIAEAAANLATSTIPQETDKKKRPSGKKNLRVLSFGGDEEEMERESDSTLPSRISSSHDAVKNDPRLRHDMGQKIDGAARIKSANQSKPVQPPEEQDPIEYQDVQVATNKANKADWIKEEILKLKRDLQKSSKSNDVKQTEKNESKSEDNSSLSLWQKEKLAYLKSKKVFVGRRPKNAQKQYEVLDALEEFKSRLHQFDLDPKKVPVASKMKPNPVQARELAKDDDAHRCLLHSIVRCKSCIDTFGEQKPLEMSEEGWLTHQLVFEKEAGERDLRQDPNELVVIDPRDKSSQILSSSKGKQ